MNQPIWKPALALLALAALSTAGCATRGFVRREVGVLSTRVDQVDGRAGRANDEAVSAREFALRGDTRAQQALRQSEVAREIALGHIRREEVRKTAVYFRFDSAELTEEGRGTLDAVVDEVKANPNYMVLVSGYTDATGDAAYNVGLAQRRAAAVNLYLAEKLGADFVRVAFVGLGEVNPVAENSTPEGRRMNRRAELAIVKPVPAAEDVELKMPEPSERETRGSTGPS